MGTSDFIGIVKEAGGSNIFLMQLSLEAGYNRIDNSEGYWKFLKRASFHLPTKHHVLF